MHVIGFRDFDAVFLAELHDDIEKVHRIERELVAEADFGFNRGQIFIGGDVRNDIENDLFNVFLRHVRGLVSNRTARSGNPIFLNNEGGVDSEHAEGIIEDGLDGGGLDGFVDD